LAFVNKPAKKADRPQKSLSLRFMTDKEYFSILYEIARHLNREFSQQAALRKSLEKTVELLGLETGWIWLLQPEAQSVYLAASYNLPPALQNHPERLSGWCYCIHKYLSGDIQAQNISEIRCTRLKDLKSGTRNLKFHATIPIRAEGVKIGLLNLVSSEIQQLDDKQLFVLDTIGTVIGSAIERTRAHEGYGTQREHDEGDAIANALRSVMRPRLEGLRSVLQDTQGFVAQGDLPGAEQCLRVSLNETDDLLQTLDAILNESANKRLDAVRKTRFHYPLTLSERELEVLSLVKTGHTNKEIAVQLFITERTVKFHLTSILSKLHVSTRTEAVNVALKRGLIGA